MRPAEPPPIRDWLFRGVGSLYSFLLVATFVPFLVFFMLAAKRRIWKATMELFPDEHQERVQEALDQVSSMLRSFVAGNALVALILMLSSWAFFLVIHLDYPFLVGSVSGVLNLVPYLGAVLAWIPPFLIGMAQWSYDRSLFRGRGRAHTTSHHWTERPDARDRGAPGAFECAFGHHRVAVLGMALGRDRPYPGDPDHGHDQGHLRSRRRLGARWPLAGCVEEADNHLLVSLSCSRPVNV